MDRRGSRNKRRSSNPNHIKDKRHVYNKFVNKKILLQSFSCFVGSTVKKRRPLFAVLSQFNPNLTRTKGLVKKNQPKGFGSKGCTIKWPIYNWLAPT